MRASKNSTPWVLALLAMSLMLAPVSLKAVIEGDNAQVLPEGIVRVPEPEEILFFGPDGRVRVIVMLSETPLHLRGYHRYPDKSIPTLGLPRLIQAVENLAVPQPKKQPLLNFLRQALDALNRPLQDPAREVLFPLKLNLFIKRVEFLAGSPQNLIPPAAAADLIQTAHELILAFASDNELAKDKAVIAAEQAGFLEALYLLELQYAQDHGIDPSTVPYPEPTFRFFNLLNAVVVMITPELFAEVQDLLNVVQVEYDRKVEALQNYDWGVLRVYEDSIPQVEAGCGPGHHRGENTTIAIVDTGVQLDHPDLAANIALNDTEISAACGVPLGSFDTDNDGLTIGDLNAAFHSLAPSCLVDNYPAGGDGEYTIDDLMYRGDPAACPFNYYTCLLTGVPSVDPDNPLWDDSDADGNCYCDDLVGWNFIPSEGQPYDPGDLMFHGTHVAGIAAAHGTYLGVAPNARILPVRVLNASGSGSSSGVIAGMDYVAGKANGLILADAMNLSLGAAINSSLDPVAQAMDNAVTAGVIAAVSAGNSGSNYYTLGSPGTSLKAITVGASDPGDNIASFSSRGPVIPENDMKPDLIAPGTGICAARLNNCNAQLFPIHCSSYCYDSNHISLNGTSMAAPHVAGAAAVLVSRFKAEATAYTPQKVKDILKQSSVDITQTSYISPFDQGAGRLDIPAACSLTTLVTPMHHYFGYADVSNNWLSEVRVFTVTNHTNSDQLYSWQVAAGYPQWDYSVSVTISPAQRLLSPGESFAFSVQLLVPVSVPSSPWPTHTYETRLALFRRAPGEEVDTLVARPWILFTKSCFLTVDVTNFFFSLYYVFDEQNNRLYWKLFTPHAEFFIRCESPVHIMFYGFTGGYNPSEVYWMAQENLDPWIHPHVQFDPDPAFAPYTLRLEPRDRDDSLIPICYSGRPEISGNFYFVREPEPGKKITFTLLPQIYKTYKISFLSNNYHLDWIIVATNKKEFYAPTGRKLGMDSDFTFTTSASDYRAPWFKLPSTCGETSYKLIPNVEGCSIKCYNPISRVNEPFYLDFPNGSWIRPLWFIPSLGSHRIAHNFLFDLNPFQSPNTSEYRSRFFNSQDITSPLTTYRIEKGLQYWDATGQKYWDVSPLVNLDSDTIPLMTGPYIWYAAVFGTPNLNGTDATVEVNWENLTPEMKTKPTFPMFANPSGDYFRDIVNIRLYESDGTILFKYPNNSGWRVPWDAPKFEKVPLGSNQLVAKSYINPVAGINGNTQMNAKFTLEDSIPDNSPPFIKAFELRANGQHTDSFQEGKQNLIRFTLGDKTRLGGPDGTINLSTVKLSFQQYGTSNPWTRFNLNYEGNNTWSTVIDQTVLPYSNKVWMNLALEAWDNYGNWIIYRIWPAFMFNPWEDYDGDGVEDIHENYDANDTYTNKPTSDPLVPEPHGLPGKCPGACYFADADGNGMIDWDDWQAVNDYLNGYPWSYLNINPPSPNVQDLDGNTILGVPDKNLYNLILLNKLVSLPGAPAYIEVVSPLDVPEVSVGDTIPIEVQVLSYLERGRAGLGVAFEVKQGQATLLGGDGPAYACSPGARYDISAIIFDYGRARMVVRVDGPGDILVDVYIPADPILKFPLVQIPLLVQIDGIP